MRRRKWTVILAAGFLLLVSALAVTLRRVRQGPSERKGCSLDFMADFYGLIEGAIRPFRQLEVRMAGIKEGDMVLDLGCATGTLTLPEKEKVGRSGYVAAVDIAPRMIAKAREEAAKRNLEIDFRVASIDALPFPDNTFDVATSSLMVHHLPSEVKLAGFKEVQRVLKAGGYYLIVDFPNARQFMGDVSLFVLHLLSPVLKEARYTLDVAEGRVPGMLEEAGFREVEEIGKFRLVGLLPVSFIGARK